MSSIVVAGAPQVRSQIELAKTLAASNLLPKQYQGKPENLLWAIQYAQALGVHPMTAVTGIHVIEGKPTASAQLIGGLVRRAGHILRVSFDRKAMRATAQIIRADDPGHTFESVWDLARAKEAGLAGKHVWKQYPDAMLKARAITEVARDAAPEALYGVIYTPEEVGAPVEVDSDGEMIVIEPAAPEAETVDVNKAKVDLVEAYVSTGLDRAAAVEAAKQLWVAEAEVHIDGNGIPKQLFDYLLTSAATIVEAELVPEEVDFTGAEAL